ncbi:hypothetical protein DFP72DRAFT_849686 [Ephemerocybe angulata]|uniref:Uncharacterized protein n=1 Tax=Ephemerocybe angulata TaxID=980116 RepID=A0A8H6HVD1_9AGAR|nr:hypothetical protein DFP72DRAFT_849686 [Tulosesus angulatus]
MRISGLSPRRRIPVHKLDVNEIFDLDTPCAVFRFTLPAHSAILNKYDTSQYVGLVKMLLCECVRPGGRVLQGVLHGYIEIQLEKRKRGSAGMQALRDTIPQGMIPGVLAANPAHTFAQSFILYAPLPEPGFHGPLSIEHSSQLRLGINHRITIASIPAVCQEFRLMWASGELEVRCGCAQRAPFRWRQNKRPSTRASDRCHSIAFSAKKDSSWGKSFPYVPLTVQRCLQERCSGVPARVSAGTHKTGVTYMGLEGVTQITQPYRGKREGRMGREATVRAGWRWRL